eukprot:CAMPEP_0206056438 /NCGR_PEP_ID=MMETSP1466-20131121/42225_1 /ASSEMBLY_ACC=CAM_ASM_001126 /TAXON_ID=44452 /ORGANISM="Pavlova gyrans, Strain CCMP608" /LENGTH=47 /DNA_ID= /DNA_START= /DNA_END= /DNA_ORIENTATION=
MTSVPPRWCANIMAAFGTTTAAQQGTKWMGREAMVSRAAAPRDDRKS